MTREEAARRYRIVSGPLWQVQSIHKGEWVTFTYFGSEEAAKKSLEKQITRLIQWPEMTEEQRMASILRNESK